MGMSINLAEKFLDGIDTRNLGPRGGNLDDPRTSRERRNAEHSGQVDENGVLRLHGFQDTAAPGLQKEQPWHRMAAMLIIANRTNKEIAEAANVTPTTVSQLRAQRWFQELLATLAHEQGQDVMSLLRSEAAASVQTLVSLRDGSESDRVKLAAATTLLEHAHGKAVQKVLAITGKASPGGYASPADEMAEIQRELELLQTMRKGPAKDLTVQQTDESPQK